MLNLKIHTIPFEGGNKIVYCPETLRFFVANEETASLAQAVSAGYAFEEVGRDYPDLSQDEFNAIKEKVIAPRGDRDHVVDPGLLQRLVINVSNDCNMRCRYCYANCGVYGGDKAMMTSDTLVATLDYFFSKYHTIGVVQLFGGEPTMNVDAMILACEYIAGHAPTTRVGFVTNGSILDEQIIGMVEKFNLSVTVSIDIETLHDRLRPFPGGSPSWSIVKSNVHRLHERTGQPSQFEFTYTKLHEDDGISIADILTELQNEYGSIPVHVTPVCTKDPKYQLAKRDVFVDSVHDIFESKAKGLAIDYSVLAGFEQCLRFRQKSDYFCNAGVGTLAVSTTGDIYPCFYHIDKTMYKMASVFDGQKIIDDSIDFTRQRYLAHKKTDIEECSSCFASTLCHGCLGSNLDTTGNEFRNPKEQCDMTKKMLENLLLELAKYTHAAEA